MRQVEVIEAERDAAVQTGAAVRRAATGAGSAARADASIAALARLKGIGGNDATLLLTHEVLYRQFRNRRELASWAGLTPTPWASGNVQRDQGIGRDGPGWIRAQLVQMAWSWVRFQPDSALSQWFQARTAGARAGSDGSSSSRSPASSWLPSGGMPTRGRSGGSHSTTDHGCSAARTAAAM